MDEEVIMDEPVVEETPTGVEETVDESEVPLDEGGDGGVGGDETASEDGGTGDEVYIDGELIDDGYVDGELTGEDLIDGGDTGEEWLAGDGGTAEDGYIDDTGTGDETLIGDGSLDGTDLFVSEGDEVSYDFVDIGVIDWPILNWDHLGIGDVDMGRPLLGGALPEDGLDPALEDTLGPAVCICFPIDAIA